MILDATCGGRSIWFDKEPDDVVFMDQRCGVYPIVASSPRSPVVVAPDILARFEQLPFRDGSFSAVLLDPPHIHRTNGLAGNFERRYGQLPGDWRDMLREGFRECLRALRPGGLLIFKWSETQFSSNEIIRLAPYAPLFGHRSGKKSGTHWIVWRCKRR